MCLLALSIAVLFLLGGCTGGAGSTANVEQPASGPPTATIPDPVVTYPPTTPARQRSDRPPLMLDEERIAAFASSSVPEMVALQNRVLSVARYYAGLELPTDSQWWNGYPNGVMALAVGWQVSGDEELHQALLAYLELASGYESLNSGDPVREVLDLGIALTNTAVAFDWARDDLPANTTNRLVDLLTGAATSASELLAAKVPSYFWNHAHPVAAGLYAAGSALAFDTAQATQWRAQAEQFFEQMELILDEAGDGAYCEGVAYSSLVYFYLAEYHELRRSITDQDPEHHWWESVPAYYAHTRRPDRQGTLRWADDPGEWFSLPVPVLRFVAALNQDSRAQSLADEFWADAGAVKYSYNLESWQELVFTDPRVPVGESWESLACWFPDWGYYVQRTSWAPTAYLLAAHSGLPGGAAYNAWIGQDPETRYGNLGHRQADFNSFSWWAGADCLLTDPGFEDLKFTNQHNTLTFGESGQIGEQGMWWGYRRDAKPWGYGGGITRVADPAVGVVVVEMQADDVYLPEANVLNYRRRLIWLKPNVLLVQDHVRIASALEITANWVTEQGPWVLEKMGGQESGDKFGARSADRINVVVLGQPVIDSTAGKVEISEGHSVYRLQTSFGPGPGTVDFCHLFWDEALDGWRMKNAFDGAVWLENNEDTLTIQARDDLIEITGSHKSDYRWDTI